ncbi:hypothetical protein [Pseudohongiella acticola]|uniref:phage major capsid protein n=1 Tax=Pseudohongiella acticola TaxID=1524254 RepID=UPI0030ED7BBD
MFIPAEGIVGAVAMREAASEMRDTIELVRSALHEKVKVQLGKSECWIDLEAIYPDRAVARLAGRFYAYPYTIAQDNTVTIGDPSEVVREFTPVGASMRESVALIEAVGDVEKSKSFQIRVIRAGTSANNKGYPVAVLREAAPLFNGTRVFIKSDDEHLGGKGKDVRNLIGGLRDAKFVEGATPDEGEIQAVLDVFDSEAVVAGKLREAVERNMNHLFGFSIDVEGTAKRVGRIMEATRFTKIHSVDLIVEAGAGGELINLIEAVASNTNDEDDAMKQRMLEAIRKANNGSLPQGLDENDEDAVFTAFKEATKPEAAPAPAKTGDEVPITRGELKVLETRTAMREAVRTSKLPEKAQDKLIKQLETDPSLTTEKFKEAISAEREYLASFTESGTVRGLGGGDGTVGTKGIAEMLDKLLDRDDNEVISLKECYLAATGDTRVTGQLRNCRFREALDTDSFPIMLGDAVNRRVLTMYSESTRHELWRQIVSDIVPLNDFRERNNVMYGGFGDLPVVAEKAPYVDLDDPTEKAEKYSPLKRGGKVGVSLEMIKNDDVGIVMRIPQSVTTAAKRTLNKFVLDIIRLNPVMSDTKALFHADHGNLGTAAFAKPAYLVARLAMMKQADHDTGEPLGLTPHILLLPADLEEDAFEAFRRETNLDPDFAQSTMPLIRPVPYWTDVSDWALIGDPTEHPTIEVGFMDGKQEPEMFIQDSPTAGSMFTNDMVTYKIRHIYGGSASSWQNMRKHVVADA